MQFLTSFEGSVWLEMVVELRLCNVEKFSYCGAACLPSWSWHDRPTWQELWCSTPALLVVARQANMTGIMVQHACPPGRGTTGQHDRNYGAARLPSWSWHYRPTWQELWCCTPALLVVAWQANMTGIVVQHACPPGRGMTGIVVQLACPPGRGMTGQHDRNCGAARLPGGLDKPGGF